MRLEKSYPTSYFLSPTEARSPESAAPTSTVRSNLPRPLPKILPIGISKVFGHHLRVDQGHATVLLFLGGPCRRVFLVFHGFCEIALSRDVVDFAGGTGMGRIPWKGSSAPKARPLVQFGFVCVCAFGEWT